MWRWRWKREYLSLSLCNGIDHACSELRAQVRLDTRDTKIEPDISSSLAVIRVVDLICQLWQQYSSIALIPLTSSSVTGRREIMIYNGQTVSRIEGLANALEQRVIDSEHSSVKAKIYNTQFPYRLM